MAKVTQNSIPGNPNSVNGVFAETSEGKNLKEFTSTFYNKGPPSPPSIDLNLIRPPTVEKSDPKPSSHKMAASNDKIFSRPGKIGDLAISRPGTSGKSVREWRIQTEKSGSFLSEGNVSAELRAEFFGLKNGFGNGLENSNLNEVRNAANSKLVNSGDKVFDFSRSELEIGDDFLAPKGLMAEPRECSAKELGNSGGVFQGSQGVLKAKIKRLLEPYMSSVIGTKFMTSGEIKKDISGFYTSFLPLYKLEQISDVFLNATRKSKRIRKRNKKYEEWEENEKKSARIKNATEFKSEREAEREESEVSEEKSESYYDENEDLQKNNEGEEYIPQIRVPQKNRSIHKDTKELPFKNALNEDLRVDKSDETQNLQNLQNLKETAFSKTKEEPAKEISTGVGRGHRGRRRGRRTRARRAFYGRRGRGRTLSNK